MGYLVAIFLASQVRKRTNTFLRTLIEWTIKAALFYTVRVGLRVILFTYYFIWLSVQWVIDGISNPDKKEEVKEKQLEALRRLGHSGLILDEYESALRSSNPQIQFLKL